MRALTHISIALAMLTTAAWAGGSQAPNTGQAQATDESPSAAVTQWTKQMELFMEYPIPVVGTPVRFIIHLTVLDGFQPVRDGQVRLTFVSQDGKEQTVTEGQLLREGIFTPTIELSDPGPQQFTLLYEGPGITDSFSIDGFKVYAEEKYLPHVHETQDDVIGFLKEQQWKIPFATAEAEIREIKRSIWAVGHVMPSPDSYVEVIAPVDGVVEVFNGNKPALPGTPVSCGDVVAIIAPPLQGNGWASTRLSYQQAKREYERAQRLKVRQAIPARDFERIENEFLAHKAGFDAFSGGGDTDALKLHAPIHGRIIEWNLKPGQRVSAGDKLMAIADSKTVWLQVNVYERDFHDLGTPVGALIKTGSGGLIVDVSELRVLSSGGALDPKTRSVPVLLQIDNGSGILKINQTVPVELYTSEGVSSPAVPVGSVYEDEGMAVVYIQAEGETFEKRTVRKGPRYQNWVAILDGIKPGERVITKGGYHVKLASTSAEIGHGHAH
jgi:RND family efflux transporter MFP subunit